MYWTNPAQILSLRPHSLCYFLLIFYSISINKLCCNSSEKNLVKPLKLLLLGPTCTKNGSICIMPSFKKLFFFWNFQKMLSKCHIFWLNNESFSVCCVMFCCQKRSFPANMAVVDCDITHFLILSRVILMLLFNLMDISLIKMMLLELCLHEF